MLRKTSPTRDIHIAEVETLIKGKEGQHEGGCDETSLLIWMHGPALLTVLPFEDSQPEMQLQKPTTITRAKVHACVLQNPCTHMHCKQCQMTVIAIVAVPTSFIYFFVTLT